MFLLLIVAMVGISLQSCGGSDSSDDDIFNTEDYTLQAKLSDSGNLSSEELTSLNLLFKNVYGTKNCTLAVAKSSLDAAAYSFLQELPTIKKLFHTNTIIK